MKWTKQRRAEASERMKRVNRERQNRKEETALRVMGSEPEPVARWLVRGYAEFVDRGGAQELAESWMDMVRSSLTEPLTVTVDVQRVSRG